MTQAAAAAEAEKAKKEQDTETEAQKAAKPKPLPVMLKGAKLAVSQPSGAPVVAPRPTMMPKPTEQAPRPAAQPVAPKSTGGASKPVKQGLYLPESISAIAARIQQADELQAR
jgi:hypothetical protein